MNRPMPSGARLALLVGIALLAGFVANALAPARRRLPWIGDYPRALTVENPRAAAAAASAASVPSGAPRFPPHPDRAYVEIGGDQAQDLFRENALFLDARRSQAYAEGHVPRARSLPVWEGDIEERVKALYSEGLDPNAPVVIYCTGGDCEDSHMLAQRIYFVGFNNALVYTGGFPDWQKRGLPVTKGTAP